MRNGSKQPLADSQPFARLNSISDPSEQLQLVHEDIYDAVRSLVAALGGPKRVGPMLFPQKSPDAAWRYLLDCLNPNRDHDLGVEGLITLLRWGRERGVHLGMHWLCDEVGYARATPVDPQDTRADLQRQFLHGVEQLEQLARRLQK